MGEQYKCPHCGGMFEMAPVAVGSPVKDKPSDEPVYQIVDRLLKVVFAKKTKLDEWDTEFIDTTQMRRNRDGQALTMTEKQMAKLIKISKYKG